MNTETVILLIVAIASLAVIAETLREAFHDGPRNQSPPRSHYEDPQLGSPGRV